MSVRPGIVASLLAFASCSDPALVQRVTDLETQVKALEAKAAADPGKGRKATTSAEEGPAATPEQETAAQDLFKAANEAAEAGNYEEAKAKLAQLNAEYGTTKAARRADRLTQELAVIGKDAGALEIEKWYQGSGDFAQGEATLLVFWESWCPHCQREVPNIEATYAKYRGEGLNVIGLTKVTRSSTDDKVTEFIAEHKVTYPIAKEQGGTMSERFAVQGIPAAAVVKDGKIVWRGHPARLTDAMIQGWLAG
jgi:thiol-disulfide isomerase/thioredoxin